MNYRKALEACLVRAAFLFHGLAGACVLVYYTQIPLYLLIGLGFLLFMVELVTTLRCNEKGEWRWFIPVVVLYIALVVPVIWVTELTLLDFRSSLNNTKGGHCPNKLLILDEIDPECKHVFDVTVGGVTEEQLESYNFGQRFSTLYQQSFMLILILGRWFMPKGGMTRDELSQLLLVYVAMAADMLEFSIETLRLEDVACERLIFIAILAVWSWSLLQFSFGQAVAYSRSRRLISGVVDRQADEPPVSCAAYLCGSEALALLTDVFLQDGPYLVIRTYVIIHYSGFDIDNTLVFFAVKNLLLVMMQLYRFSVLIIETGDEAKKRLAATQELGLYVLQTLQSTSGELHGRPSVVSLPNGGFEPAVEGFEPVFEEEEADEAV